MRRTWAAAGLLAVMVALSAWHMASIGALTGEVAELLARAEAQGEAGNWQEAARLTRRAESRWRGRDFYLHATLPHQAVDEVELGLGEVLELIQAGEAGEYSAANARLMTRLRLIAEAERPGLENLL